MNERFSIILAEDNSADADLVRRALLSTELIANCTSSETAQRLSGRLVKLDTNPDSSAFDLLILDMHLSKENGEAVLNCLRSTAHYRQTPVVVMASEDTKLLAKQAGHFRALSFFQKSSSLDEFMQLGALVRSMLSVAKKAESRSGSPDNRSAGAA